MWDDRKMMMKLTVNYKDTSCKRKYSSLDQTENNERGIYFGSS